MVCQSNYTFQLLVMLFAQGCASKHAKVHHDIHTWTHVHLCGCMSWGACQTEKAHNV